MNARQGKIDVEVLIAMSRKSIVLVAAVAALTLGDLPMTNLAQAGGIFDMMNPSRWFGDNDRDYYRRGWGYGPGYYGGGWGGPYGYPGGWGGPWGGYPGGWGWGYPGHHAYPYVVAPSSGTTQQQQPAPRLPE